MYRHFIFYIIFEILDYFILNIFYIFGNLICSFNLYWNFLDPVLICHITGFWSKPILGKILTFLVSMLRLVDPQIILILENVFCLGEKKLYSFTPSFYFLHTSSIFSCSIISKQDLGNLPPPPHLSIFFLINLFGHPLHRWNLQGLLFVHIPIVAVYFLIL